MGKENDDPEPGAAVALPGGLAAKLNAPGVEVFAGKLKAAGVEEVLAASGELELALLLG